MLIKKNFIQKKYLQKHYGNMHFFHCYLCSSVCFANNFICVNFMKLFPLI
jgi:hypothetical protein